MGNMKQRGQSFVEFTVFLPIFLIIMTGIAEMGYYINRYLNLLDATRESARYVASLDPTAYNPIYNWNSPYHDASVEIDCDAVQDFYAVAGCYILDLTGLSFNPDNDFDDIVVTAFQIRNGVVVKEFPQDTTLGWSMYGNQNHRMPIESLNQQFDDLSPQQGIVIVEVYYMHQQLLNFPLFTVFVPEGIGIHAFTFMPNATAGTLP